MKTLLRFALVLPAAALFVTVASAQVPQMLSYQGRVQSGGTNFNGIGKFKFALMWTSATGATAWSNDGTSSSGSEPTNAVSLPVVNGVYSVLLGDTSITNMTQAVSATAVFNFTTDVRLRVWFDDGVHGSQLLTPDQKIAATGWSMVSSTVANSGVTTNSIANGAVTAAKIAPVGITNPGITASQIANSTITGTQIAGGAVGTTQLAANSVGTSQLAANSVTASQIAANTITASQIAASTITGAQIADRGIAEPDLGINSVTFFQLADASVHSVTLQDAAVTNPKIANGAIDVSKFGITATTKITNLNADLLDGVDSTAFVLKAGDTMTGRLLMLSAGYLDCETSAATTVTGISSASNGTGVYGVCNIGTNAWGVYGGSSSGFAGYFDGKVQINGVATVQVLTITGGSDLAEPFNLSKRNIPKGSVVVIDESAPGNLTLSNRPYDQRVAGIVSGANGVKPGIQLHQEGVMDGDENVALSGRVYVCADASNGAIKPGDLLTTSRVPGHAMRVTNHAKAQGAIIGKAMSSLDDGSGMVLVLVTLQ